MVNISPKTYNFLVIRILIWREAPEKKILFIEDSCEVSEFGKLKKGDREKTMKLEMTKIAANLLVLVILGGLPAQADPMIDGKFDLSEGYTTGYYVNFNVEDTGPISYQGELWTHQNSTGLSVAFIQPKSLVDNSYGANAVGWGSIAHPFDKLIGSDKAQFSFTDRGGFEVLNVTLDYLEGTGTYVDKRGNIKVDRNAPLYVSGLTGRDSAVDVGLASDLIASATSLEWNYNNLGGLTDPHFGKDSYSPLTSSDTSYTVTESGYENWIFDVIYEFKIDSGVFGTNGFGGMEIIVVHDSPNKLGKNKVWQEGDLEPVPVPGAVLLGMLGLGVAGVKLRKFA